MSKNIRQTALGLGYKKQTDLQTASLAADFWRVTKYNRDVATVEPVVETNQDEIGVGSEFASQLYKSHTNVSGNIEKAFSSELLAWAFAFTLGSTTTAAAGATGTKYTSIPSGPCDPLDLDPFSLIEKVGEDCGDPALDRVLVGNVINDLSLSIQNGPGKRNAMMRVGYLGCGKVVSPSTIVLPATMLTEHGLLPSSGVININGIDYVSNKNFVSLEFGIQNNVRSDEGFYIGSGSHDGFAIRGRMERGDRVISLSFVARFDENSTELDKLMALTTGSASFSLKGALIEGAIYHEGKVTIPQVAFSSAVLGESNGVYTVQVGCTIMDNLTDPVITTEVNTVVSDICG